MNSNINLLEDLQKFVVEVRWKYDFPLQRETKIEKELKITGDDAVEFIEAFSQKFNVDITNFEFEKYFEPEGDIILPAIIRFITREKKKKQAELTLGNLESAIREKKLDEEVINGGK
jgi:hypothetical protein